MSCAASNLCQEHSGSRSTTPTRKPAAVIRLEERTPRPEPRTSALPWTRSELAAVVGSTLVALSLGGLLAFEMVTKLQPPTVF